MAVDGDLPEAESKALAAHLRDCDRCREAVRGAAQTHRVLLESLLDPAVRRPQEKPVTRRTARSFRAPSDSPWKVFLIAAGVLVGIVAVLFMATDSSQNPEAEVRRARRAAEERRNQLRQEQAHMERARLDAEEKLAALRKEQDRLDLERKSSPPPPSEDLRKKADQAFEDILRRRKEEEEKLTLLKGKEEVLKEAVAKEATPDSPRPNVAATQAAVATLERSEGEVVLVSGTTRTPAKAGDVLRNGQGLETVGDSARAVFSYADKTQVEIGPSTRLDEMKVDGGKLLRLSRGSLRAVVAKQPKDQPMIVSAPQGEAKVVGTTLRIVVDPDPKKAMRLEVEEGKVELRNLEGRFVLVESGHFAVATSGEDLRVQKIPINEILLLPSQVRMVGGDWRVVKDEKALSGQTLEGTRMVWTESDVKKVAEAVRKPVSVAIFTFPADPDKDYRIWIRGHWRFKTNDHHGSVALAFPDGLLRPPCPWFSQVGENAFMFDWFSRQEGYWWAGGNEGGGPENNTATVRFFRSGEQTLRLHLTEPIRIDAIWLSATQKTRPAPDVRGPVPLRK
jgi:hypothetical protein